MGSPPFALLILSCGGTKSFLKRAFDGKKLPYPFVDGVLVGRHPRPDVRRHCSVIIVIVPIIFFYRFLGEVFIQVVSSLSSLEVRAAMCQAANLCRMCMLKAQGENGVRGEKQPHANDYQ